jgi:NhaP-type Na+/H+ or K+/H+ antiporter
MESTITILVLTLLVIVVAAVLGAKLRIAAPLILVAAGIAISFAPFAPHVVIDPHLILAGVLPPLLYSSAASIPAMNFRREFGAIGGLSIVLVVLTSLILGGLFAWFLPDLGFVWGVALGAIISPTDAVATSIIKSAGAPSRVIVILEGESLLNDASALVLLRTAIVTAAAGFSALAAVGSFLYAVVVAVLIGAAVGWISVWLRGRMKEPAVNTILSFTVPFVAALPTEHLGGSGLVAAVVAGLVTGVLAPRRLSPAHRLSDNQTWSSLGLALEGFVFLTMGVQLSTILDQVGSQPAGLSKAFGVAGMALAATLLIRGCYVAFLFWSLHRRRASGQDRQAQVAEMQRDLDAGQTPRFVAEHAERRSRPPSEQFMDRLATRVRRVLADFDYFERQPLGVAEGAVVVWAGMRGAVTVAAAQLLPAQTPHRPMLIFIAFAVAGLSLLIQGGAVGLVVARLFKTEPSAHVEVSPADRRRIRALLAQAAKTAPQDEAATEMVKRVAVIQAQRSALLDARDDGVIDAEALSATLVNLDAEQLTLELRGRIEVLA